MQQQQLSKHQRRQAIENLMRDAGLHQGMQSRSVSVRAPQADDAIRWVLTTEQPATVFSWSRYDFVGEVLLMEGMLVPEIGKVSLLDCHSRSTVDDILGSVTDFQHLAVGGYPAIDGLVAYAADDKSQRTRQKVLDGHLTDGSVGYEVLKSVWIPEGEEAAIKNQIFKGPLQVTYEWLLKEFSNTPIGADTLAKVRSLCAFGTCRLVNQ